MSLEEKSENTQNSTDKDVFNETAIKSILQTNHSVSEKEIISKSSARRSSISFGFLNGKNHADGTSKRRKSISVILLGRKTNKVRFYTIKQE